MSTLPAVIESITKPLHRNTGALLVAILGTPEKITDRFQRSTPKGPKPSLVIYYRTIKITLIRNLSRKVQGWTQYIKTMPHDNQDQVWEKSMAFALQST